VLKILDDYWFDTKSVLIPDSEGRLGIGPNTGLYKCTVREACLPNTSTIPNSMYCHENHTGILCERCFQRGVDCGRVAGSGEACVAPAYGERGEEWMYFAKIARQCARCPVGATALWFFVITLAAVVGAIVVTIMLG
jgi:hypothetical protein|tara:strand:- start:240 stop:650 length:411 start_codon:yes stop_codon:yes gene_type:complete